METLRVQLEEKKAQRFRAIAMQAFGHGKGALSKAADAAIDCWLSRIQYKGKRMADIDSLVGLAKRSKSRRMSSVEEQHRIAKLWAGRVD